MASEAMRVQEEILASEAAAIDARLQVLGHNYWIFHRNYDELWKVLAAKDKPEVILPIMALERRADVDLVLLECARLLINFAVSAKILIDHTRIVVDRFYRDTDFHSEYRKEIGKRFDGNATAGFIEDLRNYAVHYQIPFTHVYAHFSRDRTEEPLQGGFIFALHKPALLQWKWSKGKAFIQSSDDKIDVAAIVAEYHDLVTDFHYWLNTRLRSIHAKELKWLDKKYAQLARLLGTSSG